MVQVLPKYQLDKNAYHSSTTIGKQNYQLSTNVYHADAGCNDDKLLLACLLIDLSTDIIFEQWWNFLPGTYFISDIHKYI